MIRRAEIGDIKDLRNIIYQIDKLHAKKRPDLFKAAQKRSKQEISDLINDDKKEFVVYEKDDKIVGYVIFELQIIVNSNQVNAEERIYIHNLCVDKKFRRRGYATRLYQYVVEYARKNNCHQILLSVWEFNKSAKRFYKSLGMKPQRTIMESIVQTENVGDEYIFG